MAKSTCPKCGAAMDGYVCAFCGAASAEVCDTASEKKALDEFHQALHGKDLGAQSSMLRSGFLPSCSPVLIDAGTRCAGLLKESGLQDAAAGRLETITLKLKLLSGDETNSLHWGCSIIAVLALLIAGLVWYAVRTLWP